MIPFNKAVYLDESVECMREIMRTGKIAGDGKYTRLCSSWMEEHFHADKILLTTSCTAALEMAAILLDIKEGDEVIMPSYTFASTANAFVLRGATPVFVDIRPDTMNIDEKKIEPAITKKTRAIVVVHYAGVACEMDSILETANRYGIPVIEDAAQGVMASYKGRALGTMGTFGCYSFHETKNYTMGEGGALLVNDEKYVHRAEILREKGTNRASFYRGEVAKYSWVDLGSSYLPSDVNAAFLYPQLVMASEINEDRLESWNYYYSVLKPLEESGDCELPRVPEQCDHNAHLFYIKVRDLNVRGRCIKYMREHECGAVFHYVPLHSSEAGKRLGRFSGEDEYTTRESERLIRLPMFYQLDEKSRRDVCQTLSSFFGMDK